MQVASAVRRAIDDSTLKPGGSVSARALAAEHGTSRPTVDSALRVLATEGRVAQLPGCGWYVAGADGSRAVPGPGRAAMPPQVTRAENASVHAPEPWLWEQVACLVRQQLDDGTLKPGDLVTIAGVLREHGLRTRQTAGRALRLLEREGRLRRFPGYGYVVQAPQGPGAPRGSR